MFGQTNKRKVSYYRHARGRKNPCTCEKSYVPAELIETAVLFQLFSLFGDKVKLDEAIDNAVPDTKFRDKVEKEIKQFEKELKKACHKKRNLINAIADGLVDKDDIKEKMESLKKQEMNLLFEIDKNKKFIENIPSTVDIRKRKELARNMLKYYKKRHFLSVRHLSKMTWEDEES